jgi:hypothetical protein
VPTSRPRHSLTETDEVARALADAARRWPEDRRSPGRLLLRLLHEGHRAIRGEMRTDAEQRRAAVAATAGSLTGVYPEGYLAELRGEWPA